MQRTTAAALASVAVSVAGAAGIMATEQAAALAMVPISLMIIWMSA